MAIHEPYTASDGYSGFSMCHTGMDPLQLSGGAFSRGINVTVRGGLLSTRPGFEDLGVLGSGAFQGAAVYSLEEADHLVYALNGKIFVRDASGKIHSIGGSMKASGPVYFAQVFKWMLCQDGESRPIVVQESGGVFSRFERDVVLDPGAPVPKICLVPGTVGAYAHGRYHYATTKMPDVNPALEGGSGSAYTNLDVLPELLEGTGRASITSSDVLDVLEPEAVFRLSEHRVLNEGASLGLPAELGFVHGMGAMRGAATGTGIGSLFVFCTRGVVAFEFGNPRAEWKNVNLSQVAFVGPGTRSPRSVFNVNDDLWYLGTEGHLRSVNYDGAQLSGGSASSAALFNVVKSIEAKRWVDQTTPAWLPHASACAADNRIHWVLADGKALGSIELAQAYDANPSEQPILHEGIWTGFDFLQVLSIGNRLHAVVSGKDGPHLLRLGSPDGYDPGGVAIRSELVTRMFPFVYNEASSFREVKRFVRFSAFFQGIDRPCRVEISYRPEHMLSWTRLGGAAYNVPANTPGQTRILSLAPDMSELGACNPVTGEPPWMFHAAQFRVEWTGRATIARLLADASIQEDVPRPACQEDNPDGVSLPIADDDDFAYTVPIGD